MNFFQFLKTNENTRKIFGKSELRIIEKQIEGVNLTQSERNRLSRDIRKKLEFIREASKFQEEFQLKKSQSINEIVNKSLEIIKKDRDFKKIKRVYLFGSFIEGKFNLSSDIDIAVEFDNITKKDAFHFRARISGEVSDKIDIQVFNVLPDKIKNSILKNNKILYQKAIKKYKT